MLKPVLEFPDSNSKANFVIPVGKNDDGRLISLDLLISRNLLVVYPNWMIGEISIIKLLLIDIISKNSPSACKLIISDIGEAGLEIFDGDPHLLTPVICEAERLIAAFNWVSKEVNKRSKMFLEFGVNSIEEYNAKAGYLAMYYLVVVTFDLGESMKICPGKFKDMIQLITKDASRTGVILVATTREPRNGITNNYQTKITYKAKDKVGVVNYLSPDMEKSKKFEVLEPDEVKLQAIKETWV